MRSPLRSRTLWVAAITGILAALNAVTDTISDAEALQWLLVLQAALTAGLRAITTEPLGKPPTAP